MTPRALSCATTASMSSTSHAIWVCDQERFRVASLPGDTRRTGRANHQSRAKRSPTLAFRGVHAAGLVALGIDRHVSPAQLPDPVGDVRPSRVRFESVDLVPPDFDRGSGTEVADPNLIESQGADQLLGLVDTGKEVGGDPNPERNAGR